MRWIDLARRRACEFLLGEGLEEIVVETSDEHIPRVHICMIQRNVNVNDRT